MKRFNMNYFFVALLLLGWMSHEASAATLVKSYPEKSSIIVDLDDNEKEFAVIGGLYLVQLEILQPDDLTDARIKHIVGSQALLLFADKKKFDSAGFKTGQIVHLFYKGDFEELLANQKGQHHKLAANMQGGELDRKQRALDDSFDRVFGGAYAQLGEAGARNVSAAEEGEAIVLKIHRALDKSQAARMAVDVCNKTGLHINHADIQLLLVDQGAKLNCTLQLPDLGNMECSRIYINTVDSAALSAATTLSVSKITVNDGALAVKTLVKYLD